MDGRSGQDWCLEFVNRIVEITTTSSDEGGD